MSWIVGGIALIVAALLISWGCSQLPGEGRAVRAAENIGVENAHVTKRAYSWGVLGGCHKDDVTKFTVTGTRNGRLVTIQVCAPILGGYTVRS